MKNIGSEKAIEKIDFLIKSLIDFSNENEFDFTVYKEFANESSKTFNRHFLQIDDEAVKEKIISDLKTDFHFSIDNIVTNMLSTKDNTQYPIDGITYYIGHPIPDTRIRSYQSNYKQLIELFLNSVEFEAENKAKDAPENEQDKMYFKVGLLFAEKKIYSQIVLVDNIKTTKYYYQNELFDNPSQLSRKLNLTRQYINDSFNGAKTKHNIFNNLKQLKNIIDYCKKNEIVIDAEFLNKYTTLVESKQ